MSERITGTIKHLNREKGFGFVTRDDGQDDLFFHRSGLRADTSFNALEEGQTVSCQVGEGRHGKGPRAEDLARA
ncbi:MAG: cold-shock protein [Vicinamibacterales bacterium]